MLIPDEQTAIFYGQNLDWNSNYLFVGARSNLDENGSNYTQQAGAVFIYKFDGKEWHYHQKVTAPLRLSNSGFSTGMEVLNNKLVVGEQYHNQFINPSLQWNEVGQAHSYYDSSGYWKYEQTFKHSFTSWGDHFGFPISGSDNELLISARLHDFDILNQDSIRYSGAVYRFVYESGQWIEKQKIVGPYRDSTRTNFGYDLMKSGDHLFITSYSNYYPIKNSTQAWGELFHYKKGVGQDWIFNEKIEPIDDDTVTFRSDFSNAGFSRNRAIEFKGDYLAFGAETRYTVQNDSFYYDCGAVYIFKLNANGTFDQVQKILPPNPDERVYFGACIKINDSLMAIGAPGVGEWLHGVPVNPNHSGAVYLYILSGNGKWQYWKEVKETGPNNPGDKFGSNILLNDNQMIVSSLQSKLGTIYSIGSVYVYDIIAPSFNGIDDELENTSIKIYPNPTSKKINIQSNEIITGIKLFDLTGQLVLKRIVTEPSEILSLDITPFQCGIYQIIIESDKHRIVRKLVKTD